MKLGTVTPAYNPILLMTIVTSPRTALAMVQNPIQTKKKQNSQGALGKVSSILTPATKQWQAAYRLQCTTQL